MPARLRTSWLLACLSLSLGCTEHAKPQFQERAQERADPTIDSKVEPPPAPPEPTWPWRTGDDWVEPDEPQQRPGELLELSYQTTECYGRCPAQDLVIRRDGAFLYIGGHGARYQGPLLGEAPAMAMFLFALASTHPFGAERAEYIAEVTDNPTRSFTTLDERGRHSIVVYGGPAFIPIPAGLYTVELRLREWIDTFTELEDPRIMPHEVGDGPAPPGPICKQYGDALRLRCETLLQANAPSRSCLHHARYGAVIQDLYWKFDPEQIEPACAFMLESLALDADSVEVRQRADVELDADDRNACQDWFEKLFVGTERAPWYEDAEGFVVDCENLFG